MVIETTVVILPIESSGTPEEREVQTGAFNNIFVEIVSGVEVGESVLLNPPRNLQKQADPRMQQTVAAIVGK